VGQARALARAGGDGRARGPGACGASAFLRLGQPAGGSGALPRRAVQPAGPACSGAGGMTGLVNRPERPIYLDYQATTPTDPRVVEVMLPLFTEEFGNPHSEDHIIGRRAAEAVERARGQVAELIGADPREIIFTSGATESNNLAIKGAARFRRAHEGRGHLVALATEHKCVLESLHALEAEGFEVELLPVAESGLVELDRFEAALRDDTAL